MDPTERIMAVFEGKVLDRVQTYCAGLEECTVQQLLGKPLVSTRNLFFNPVSSFLLDRWGEKIDALITRPSMESAIMKRIEAAVALGFDATAVDYDWRLMIHDSRTCIRKSGWFHDMLDDGHGNVYFSYRGPALSSPEAFESWPYFPDPDDIAHRCYTFYKKAVSRYGEKICILGETCTSLHDVITLGVGFEKAPLWIRRKADFIKKLISMSEELCMKTIMATMDAGIKIILQCDDFSFKSGPMLNPMISDELFGESYMRITKAVHDRKGIIAIHSCGDNTKLFDNFIKWGFDGGHAFENTSNVDIAYEKKKHGDRFTIIGGMGIDYLLTERSKPEEVVEGVKHLLRTCAPGGRFLIGPVHSHSDVEVSKLKMMIEATREYGRYPITV